MPKDLTFEVLLSIPRKAYELKTGEKFQYVPAYIYETFANTVGWGGQSLFEKILSPNGYLKDAQQNVHLSLLALLCR